MASIDKETAKKILNQVEFYFSDSNLPRDEFLHKTVSQSKDGMVNLDIICSFSRMRNYLGLGRIKRNDISEVIIEGVAEILRKSDFLKVSDDGKKIGRIKELCNPEEVIEQVDKRTIAASPFGYDVKIEDVESFFAQYGKVNSVRLPHHLADKKCFCGTALIEFSADEDAEAILNQDLAFSGASLELKPKKEFDSERRKLLEDIDKSHKKSSYPKGLLVSFTFQKISMGLHRKKNEDSNPGNSETQVASEDIINSTKKKKKKQKSKKKKAQEQNSQKDEETIGDEIEQKNSGDVNCQPREKSAEIGCLEELTGEKTVPNEDYTISCEDLKNAFQRFGSIKHVDYSMGADSGYICFEEIEAAIKARAAAAFVEGLTLKKLIASVEAVTGEAEREYWKTSQSNREQFDESKDEREQKGKFNKDRRNPKGKRSHSKENDYSIQQPTKAQKAEAV